MHLLFLCCSNFALFLFFALFQSFGHLTPPVSQAWTIDRLRPSPPFNPFLAEYLNSVKKQNNSASTTSLNANSPKITSLNNVRSQSAGGGVPSIMSFSSNYNNAAPTVTNEEEFAILALVDSFCTTNRHTGNLLYKIN